MGCATYLCSKVMFRSGYSTVNRLSRCYDRYCRAWVCEAWSWRDWIGGNEGSGWVKVKRKRVKVRSELREQVCGGHTQ
jgi:hypothetical protein